MLNEKSKKSESEIIAMRVSITTLVANTLLSLLKLLAGVIAHSAAMVSDAIHSASDVMSTLVVMVGIKISNKPADKEHPYGHERLECVVSIILAIMLASVGLGIGYDALIKIFSQSYEGLEIPGMLALVASIVSIAAKEIMYRYTMHYAKKINSTALKADAWHHRSDSLSSIGALIGIAGARMGFPILDSVASLVICGFILKVALEVFFDATNKMVDRACDEDFERAIRKDIKEVPGVVRVQKLKTRAFSAKAYVDVVITVDGNLTLREATEISRKVHDKLEKDFPEIKHCNIRTMPA